MLLTAVRVMGLERAAGAVTKLAGQARQFGARAIVFSSGGLSQTGEFSEDGLEQKAKALDLAARRCADAGLTLATGPSRKTMTEVFGV